MSEVTGELTLTLPAHLECIYRLLISIDAKMDHLGIRIDGIEDALRGREGGPAKLEERRTPDPEPSDPEECIQNEPCLQTDPLDDGNIAEVLELSNTVANEEIVATMPCEEESDADIFESSSQGHGLELHDHLYSKFQLESSSTESKEGHLVSDVKPIQVIFICGVCQKQYAVASEMEVCVKSHKVINPAKRTRSATYCGSSSITAVLRGLRQKRRQQTTIQPVEGTSEMPVEASTSKVAKVGPLYQCELCPYSSKRKADFVRHKMTVHENLTESEGSVESSGTSGAPKGLHQCELCSYTSKRRGDVARHKGLIHPDSVDVVKQSLYKCNLRPYTTGRREELARHNSEHDHPIKSDSTDEPPAEGQSELGGKKKVFKCDLCPHTTKRKWDMVRHKSVHTGEKPHTCDICNKRFSLKGILTIHRQTVHTEERHFCCEVCGKVFKYKAGLDYHVKRHKGEKPFSCPVCQKRFLLKVSLKNHMRVHTGEKPYSCPICKMAYNHITAMKYHMNKFHGIMYKQYKILHSGAAEAHATK